MLYNTQANTVALKKKFKEISQKNAKLLNQLQNSIKELSISTKSYIILKQELQFAKIKIQEYKQANRKNSISIKYTGRDIKKLEGVLKKRISLGKLEHVLTR